MMTMMMMMRMMMISCFLNLPEIEIISRIIPQGDGRAVNFWSLLELPAKELLETPAKDANWRPLVKRHYFCVPTSPGRYQSDSAHFLEVHPGFTSIPSTKDRSFYHPQWNYPQYHPSIPSIIHPSSSINPSPVSSNLPKHLPLLAAVLSRRAAWPLASSSQPATRWWQPSRPFPSGAAAGSACPDSKGPPWPSLQSFGKTWTVVVCM